MASDAGTRVMIGILPAVVLKVVGGERSFTTEEATVLAAMRRSNSDLANASADEIADHIGKMTPEQLAGFHNNVKGIYHELRYVGQENADQDYVEAETYELVNHPGADVRLVNGKTGETVDIQLKATDSMASVREHQERYPDVEIHVTEEAVFVGGRRRVIGIQQRGARSRCGCDLGEAERRWQSHAGGRICERNPVGCGERASGPPGRAIRLKRHSSHA